MLALLIILFGNLSYAGNDATLTKLKNIPDGQIAACKVKSNDFQFLCLLNTKNYYSCKFMIGTKFVLPKCEECKPVKPVKPKVSNPFLDAIIKMNENNRNKLKM